MIMTMGYQSSTTDFCIQLGQSDRVVGSNRLKQHGGGGGGSSRVGRLGHAVDDDCGGS